MNKTYIYTLSDPRNGHVRYVGKSDNPDLRMKMHFRDLNNTKKESWIKSLLKLNLSPVLDIVDEVPVSDWVFWEMHYISLFKYFGFKLTNGTVGGDGGRVLNIKPISEELRNKFREIARNRTVDHINKIRKSKIGKKPSVETLEKLRYSHRFQDNRNLMKPVIQMDLNGNFIREFESISAACRHLKKGNSQLVSYLKHKKDSWRHCFGYKWKYSDLNKITKQGQVDIIVNTAKQKGDMILDDNLNNNENQQPVQ